MGRIDRARDLVTWRDETTTLGINGPPVWSRYGGFVSIFETGVPVPYGAAMELGRG
jgi:hypothetical protein